MCNCKGRGSGRRYHRGDDESADKSHVILLEHCGVCSSEDVREKV
jgi:hypothetical protein